MVIDRGIKEIIHMYNNTHEKLRRALEENMTNMYSAP